MNSIQLAMVAQTPSRFGMPASGQAFVDLAQRGTGWRAAVNGTAVPSTRYRVAGSGGAGGETTKGHLGLIPACVEGTSAWRPPIS